jgi:Ca2+-binding RTX toxin-like protein
VDVVRRNPSLLATSIAAFALSIAGAAPAGAAPTCEEGPQTVGSTIEGTPCADTIRAAPDVLAVNGGPGDDMIIPAAITAATPLAGEEWLGVGSQTFEGGPGDDLVFGERGNDTLLGGEGNDRLYGGIGDDLLRGGPGQDQLAGGHGVDSIDGDAGDDYVRGDGTIDRIFDTGGGTDTLSYSTGITPGFGGDMSAFPSFPAAGGERGVHLDLKREFAPGERPLNGDNGVANFGGGFDEVERGAFERMIGTAFSDYIVGSDASEEIYGGGGADVIVGEGGNDSLFGGADGDHLDGAAGSADSVDGGPGEDHCQDAEATLACDGKGPGVVVRNTAKISVGFEVAPTTFSRSQLYLVGSSGSDSVTATYSTGSPATVTFEAGSVGALDAAPSASADCGVPNGSAPERVVCTLSSPLESLVMAGMGSADELRVFELPSTVSLVLLGGAGGDILLGGDATEDVLVDGDATASDADTLMALGRDDALLHNSGSDTRQGGDGNDLFLSTSICDGDELGGEAGRDNGSWARLDEAVQANLELGLAGRPDSGPTPQCGPEQPDSLQTIEDLEGTSPPASSQGDRLYGDLEPNQLLGWEGPDSFFAASGDDTILANSGDTDVVIDCGNGNDKALIDQAGHGYDDPAPVDCERMEEAAINSFRFKTLLPPPPLPPEATSTISTPQPPKRPPVDRTQPRTALLHHPPRVVFSATKRRRVAVAFTSHETGSSFRCKLDSRPFKPCRSPRAYTVWLGRHTIRVYAIDAAGNRDRTPAVVSFRVRRR